MHKNKNLLQIDDLDIGDEVTYAIKCQSEARQDQKKMDDLALYINNHMDRILLSKMNQEVSKVQFSNNALERKKAWELQAEHEAQQKLIE